jgi:hypothetical protein
MKITDLDVRPEVARFALLMEAKLRANDHKRPWRHCPLQYLSMRLTQERKELAEAIATKTGVGEECADIANFAMMVADKVGDLPPLPGGGERVSITPKGLAILAGKCGIETEASD